MLFRSRALRLLATTVTRRDLNGAFLGTEENTYSAIDAHGNAGKLLCVLKDAAGTAIRSSTVTNTYTNIEGASWLIGLLDASETRTEVPLATPSSAITRRVTYAYDPATGRKLRESLIDPASGVVIRQTDSGVAPDGTTLLDAFGQKIGRAHV